MSVLTLPRDPQPDPIFTAYLTHMPHMATMLHNIVDFSLIWRIMAPEITVLAAETPRGAISGAEKAPAGMGTRTFDVRCTKS